MAENYFPSSVGIGQGGAQVLQGRTPQLSASGIVRGIEQVGKDIREEQAYQKQIELAKAKERNERLNALNETISKIQIPDNTSAAEMVVGEMWNRINKGEDYETVFQESIGNIEKIRKADNFIVQNRENLENKRYWDEESGQYMFAGDLIGNYMDGDISDRDILEEGGVEAYVGSLYGTFDPLSRNWYDMASTDITKAAADFLNEKFKAKGKTTAEEVLFDSGRTGIKTVTKISPEDLDAAEQEMLASEGLKQMFLASIGFPYRHDIEGGNKKYADFVKEALYGEKVKYSNFTSPKDDKGGFNFNFGNGSGENERFYFKFIDKAISVPKDPLNGGMGKQKLSNMFISAEAKGTNPYQDWRTGEGQEAIREALVSIKLDENGNPTSVILTNEEEVPYEDNKFILEKEYGLTPENIKNLIGSNQQSDVDEFSEYEVTE